MSLLFRNGNHVFSVPEIQLKLAQPNQHVYLGECRTLFLVMKRFLLTEAFKHNSAAHALNWYGIKYITGRSYVFISLQLNTLLIASTLFAWRETFNFDTLQDLETHD